MISPIVAQFLRLDRARTASGASATLQTKGAKARTPLLSEGSTEAIIMKCHTTGKGEGELGAA